MRKTLLVVLVLMSISILIVLGLAMRQPADYQIERTVEINTPSAHVYAIASDFRQFGTWSPWEKLDPSMQKTFGGTQREVGSTFEWNGNDDVGAGKMTIIEAVPPQLVRVKLEFFRPFADTSETLWSLVETGRKTMVTWTMTGKHNALVSKVMWTFIDMDKMLGDQFHLGLSQLKGVAEKSYQTPQDAAADETQPSDANPSPELPAKTAP